MNKKDKAELKELLVRVDNLSQDLTDIENTLKKLIGEPVDELARRNPSGDLD